MKSEVPSVETTMPSLDQLPPEVLHDIFYHLGIAEILRIRRVSRYLNGVTHSRDVWSDAYRRADFIRPPGPFLSQSAIDLEHALVTSFRFDQSLCRSSGTAQTEIPTRKLREIRYSGKELHVSLVFRRFLLVAFSEEVRCYDLNIGESGSNLHPSIVYRSTGGILRSCHCVSATNLEGRPFACIVLNEETQMMKQISVYLLNVGETSKVTLDFLHQFQHSPFDVDDVDLGARVIVIRCRAGDGFDIDWHFVALDVHTRMEFLLPSSPRGALKTLEVEEVGRNFLPSCISTSTHLLIVWSFYTLATGWSTLFQAFALPPSDTYHYFASTLTPLTPSHSSVISGVNLYGAKLLHDSILDPAAQEILIAIQVDVYETSRPANSLLKYGIFRLGTAHAHHGQGTVTFQLLGSLGWFFQMPIFPRSSDGTNRVIHSPKVIDFQPIFSILEYDLRASVTSDGKQRFRIVKYPSVLRLPKFRKLVDYDPYSGRLCLKFNTSEFRAIEILDAAV